MMETVCITEGSNSNNNNKNNKKDRKKETLTADEKETQYKQ